jgi:tetratricopeptide (TPR) repeat protein
MATSESDCAAMHPTRTTTFAVIVLALGAALLAAAATGCGAVSGRAPTGLDRRLEEGRALATQGKMAEAAEAFEDATYADPESAEAHYLLAKARLELGRTYPALDAARAAQKLRADHGPQQVLLGRIYLRLGRDEEASREIVDAVARWPDSAVAHHAAGLLRVRQGRLGEAEVSLNTAVRLDPRVPGLQELLGRVLLRLGRTDQAVARFEEALRQRSCDDLAYGGLGAALLASRQPGRAQEAFASAAECAAAGDDGAWRAGLALAYAAEGRFDEAYAQRDAIGRVARPVAGAALEDRLSRARGGRAAAGCTAHETICAQADERLWSAALLLFALGAADAAEREAHAALALDDGDAATHWILAEALAELGRTEDAGLEIDRAMAWSPSPPLRAALEDLMTILAEETAP